MTKLALYEKKQGKRDILLSRYYRGDYVRMELLKTLVSVTLGSFLLVLAVIIYKAEYLIAEATRLDYISIGKTLLGMYIIIMVVFGILSVVGYTVKYNLSRKKLARYFRLLKRLRKMSNDERPQENEFFVSEENAGEEDTIQW